MKKLWIFTCLLIVLSSYLMASDQYCFTQGPVEGQTEGDGWYYEPNDEPNLGEMFFLWINNPVCGYYVWDEAVSSQQGFGFGFTDPSEYEKQYEYHIYTKPGRFTGFVESGYNTGIVFPYSSSFRGNDSNNNGGAIYVEQSPCFEDQYFHGEQIYDLPFGAYIPDF